MTIEITVAIPADALAARRREHGPEGADLRAPAPERVGGPFEPRDPLAELRHRNGEVHLVHRVAGSLDGIDERAAGEEVSVRAIEDPALGVAEAPEQKLQANRPIGDVRGR